MTPTKEKPGIVRLHNKEYQTVALRVAVFREEHPDWSLTTDILVDDGKRIVMKTTIADEAGHIISTGHAEEIREGRGILATSALEVCETSAAGRALAFYKLDGDAQIASADEVRNAIRAQERMESQPAPAPKPSGYTRADKVKPASDYDVDVWSPDGSTWSVQMVHSTSKAKVMSASSLGSKAEAQELVDDYLTGA